MVKPRDDEYQGLEWGVDRMDKQDYQKLANEFIDMWQKQLQTVVTDKQFVESMFAGLQQMANVANAQAHEQPTSPAPHDVSERFGELEFRLRMAEERLRKLESKRKSKKDSKKSAKRSSK